MIAAGVRRSSTAGIPFALAVAALITTPGCAEFAELISFDRDETQRAAVMSEAEQAQLWEMTLMAGRYGVMLGQAREILRLPEPKNPSGDTFPGDSPDDKTRREALAAYQANVAAEFAADVDAACRQRRVPRKLRKLACDQRTKLPAELRAPAEPEMLALALRNDHVGAFVMPWWNAVCETAPKARGDDAPVCAME